jgi:hypothetical protein
VNPWLLRWLIAILLLANLAFYFWPKPDLAQVEYIRPSGVKSLVLLAELPPPVVMAETQRAVTEPPGDFFSEEAEEFFTDVEAAAETDAITESVATIETQTSEAVLVGSDENAITLVEEDSALVSGPASAVASVPASRSPLQEPVAEPAPPLASCWLVGPLDQTATREALAATLNAVDIQLDLVLQTVAAEPDHWVYLPLDGSNEERRQLSAELRQQGIDNFPINSGELSGDLSLGLFRSEERAHAVTTSVREQGYAAEIYERPRSRDEAWAVLQGVDLDALGWPAETRQLADFPSLRLMQRECAEP